MFWDLFNNVWINIDVIFKNRFGVGFFFIMLRQEIFNLVQVEGDIDYFVYSFKVVKIFIKKIVYKVFGICLMVVVNFIGYFIKLL